MAWIVKRKRKDGTPVLRVSWRDGLTRKQCSETFLGTQDREAKSFRRDVEAAGEQWPIGWVPGLGYPIEADQLSGYTVRSAALKAIEVNVRATEGTKADYRREVDRYLPAGDTFAETPVEHLTVQDIEEWHAGLAAMQTRPGGPANSKRKQEYVPAALSAKTRRNAHARLSAGLDAMVRYEVIPRNIAVGLGPGRSRSKKVQALSPAEYQALLGYVPEAYHPLVETLARTGMRFSEATALTVRRVDLTADPPMVYVEQAWKRTQDRHRFVKGEPKSGAGFRTIPIDAHLADLLRPLLAGGNADDEVFETAWGAVVRHNNFYYRVWRPAVLRAHADGVIGFVPTIHDLRHAHASWLLGRGVPVTTVADRLGHDPAVLLRTYAHLMDGARNLAPAVIGDLLDADEDTGDDHPDPAGTTRTVVMGFQTVPALSLVPDTA